MSVLIFVDHHNGTFKKNAFEVITYGRQIAQKNAQEITVVVLGKLESGEIEKLGKYGAGKVKHVSDERLNTMTPKSYSKAITTIAKSCGASTIILSNNSIGKSIGPAIAVAMDASLLSGVSTTQDADAHFTKTVYSGKASVALKPMKSNLVITLNPNSIKTEEIENTVSVEDVKVELSATDFDYKIVEIKAESMDHIPLPDADLVVSAGRGLKGPENWGIIEDLANAIGATTACSRPVADIGWRPHHEHVGQTGLTIKPSLYIAIGISGAIQHLAGVNQSKCIVVINKDPEAPFFKAADYGIVGDAFEIVPKLTQAVLKLKGK
ncbi:MAG: electron transfer flavoprotein subunit alpha/FixB family protein [Bacteroidetes bacterium]|nr:electron transfer flavoprotein subunit alpha/FixB family protein [Bacteroidota bacterium]MBP9548107.1 electron transfer flavoprotein subunit alpha/FixB family protein [Chitinophagales bacterium]